MGGLWSRSKTHLFRRALVWTVKSVGMMGGWGAYSTFDEFGKRLDMSLARRSENEETIKEIEKILEEKCAIGGVPDYGEQEEFDQEERKFSI